MCFPRAGNNIPRMRDRHLLWLCFLCIAITIHICVPVVAAQEIAPTGAAQPASTNAEEDKPISSEKKDTPSSNTYGAWGQLLLAMAIVVGLIVGLGWLVKRLGGGKALAGAGALKLVARANLSPKHQIFIVRMGKRLVLIGAGPQGLATLSEVTDTGDIAHSEVNRKNPCFLCARMRRQRLYELADAENCNKIAFGHHKDDIIETFLLNIFYGREISTMLPKQSVFGGKFFLIRPLAYIFESELKAFAREQRFNVIKNGCPTEPVSKRSYVKKLLEQLERDYRGTKENIFKSLKNVKPDYLL